MYEIVYFTLLIPVIFYSIYLCKNNKIIWYSNAFFISAAFIHGLLLKPLFFLIEIPSKESAENSIFPISYDEYWESSIPLLFVYFIYLISSNISLRGIIKKGNNGSCDVLFRSCATFLSTILVMIGIYLFISKFPMLLETFNKGSISNPNLEDYTSGGIYRTIIGISPVVMLFSIYNIGRNYKLKYNFIILICNVFMYLFYALLSDQRAIVINLMITLLITYHIFVRSISKKTVILFIIIGLMIGIFQTFNRDHVNIGDIKSKIENLVSNINGRNGIENSKTILIIKSTPEVIEYKYGSSLLDSLLILIPREIFPEKKTVNIETELGFKLFNADNFGAGAVPPGLIAEMFINFNIIGIFFGIVIVGIFSNTLDKKFKNTSSTLLYKFSYILGLSSFGAGVLGSSLSGMITHLIIQLSSLCFLYYFSKFNRPNKIT
jgi:oligosaccharide repeat unit polymerase